MTLNSKSEAMSVLTIRKIRGDSWRVQNRTLLSLDYREELPQLSEMYTTVFGGEMAVFTACF